MIAVLVLMRRSNLNYLTGSFAYTYMPKRSILDQVETISQPIREFHFDFSN